MIVKEAAGEIFQQAVVFSPSYALPDDVLKHGIYYRYVKRIMDLVLGAIGFVLSVPIVLIFAIAVKLDSPGPAFYLQERVGMNGRSFKVIKLRSMVQSAEANGSQWAVKNDPRVTKVGTFIRKTRIDELPQFFNILRGEMSIVGPRPERMMFTLQFNSEVPGFIQRVLVKPGLTGLAQVNGGYEITPKEKFELDMRYIRQITWRMDAKIMLKTVKVIFTGEGAR